jgi:hypothetical protein
VKPYSHEHYNKTPNRWSKTKSHLLMEGRQSIAGRKPKPVCETNEGSPSLQCLGFGWVDSSDHVTQQSHTIFNNKIALPLDEHTYHNKFGKINFHNSQLEYIIQVKYSVNLNSSVSELIPTELKITNLVEELIEA